MDDFIVKKGRIVCLDTETTGIKPELGHRVIEIGCVEIVDLEVREANFHCYLNPMRKVDPGSFAVHGLSDAFLADKPLFSTVVSDFCKFIEGSTLVIHNAAFDLGFLNNELKLLGMEQIKNRVIDTVAFSKRKFPGSPASLDALCKRFNISLDDRTLHGALIDAKLLSQVYINLCGGSQVSFFDQTADSQVTTKDDDAQASKSTSYSNLSIRVIEPTSDELLLHSNFAG